MRKILFLITGLLISTAASFSQDSGALIEAPNIKVVSIDGKLPTKEDINAKTYPYARPTFYYVNAAPNEKAEKFIEFTLSPKGKEIMEKMGFIAPQ